MINCEFALRPSLEHRADAKKFGIKISGFSQPLIYEEVLWMWSKSNPTYHHCQSFVAKPGWVNVVFWLQYQHQLPSSRVTEGVVSSAKWWILWIRSCTYRQRALWYQSNRNTTSQDPLMSHHCIRIRIDASVSVVEWRLEIRARVRPDAGVFPFLRL